MCDCRPRMRTTKTRMAVQRIRVFVQRFPLLSEDRHMGHEAH